jgi:hypothetical protein
MRRLRFHIITLVAVAIIVWTIIALTTSDPFTNAVAINQLNGGNEAYLASQIYYQYKDMASVIGIIIIVLAAMPIIKIIYTTLKEKNK